MFTLSWLSARMPVHKSLRQFSHYTTHCHCSVAVSAGVGMWADEFEISDIWWDYSPSSAFTSIFKADKGSPTLYTSTGVILHTKQSTIKQWQATISCLQGPQSPSQPQYINVSTKLYCFMAEQLELNLELFNCEPDALIFTYCKLSSHKCTKVPLLNDSDA